MEQSNWRPDHDPFKSDAFCLGLTMLSVASLENCYKIYNFHKYLIYDDLIRDLIESLRNKYSLAFIKFIQDMLILNEEKRPDFLKLRQNLEIYKLSTSKQVKLSLINRIKLILFIKNQKVFNNSTESTILRSNEKNMNTVQLINSLNLGPSPINKPTQNINDNQTKYFSEPYQDKMQHSLAIDEAEEKPFSAFEIQKNSRNYNNKLSTFEKRHVEFQFKENNEDFEKNRLSTKTNEFLKKVETDNSREIDPNEIIERSFEKNGSIKKNPKILKNQKFDAINSKTEKNAFKKKTEKYEYDEEIQNNEEMYENEEIDNNDENQENDQDNQNLNKNMTSEIEQDLESINAILDRYGISPLTKISAKNYQASNYSVKISREVNEKPLNFGKKSTKPRRNDINEIEDLPEIPENSQQESNNTYDYMNNFKKKNQISAKKDQGKGSSSYLLSQDYELSRPYELEPNYSNYNKINKSFFRL